MTKQAKFVFLSTSLLTALLLIFASSVRAEAQKPNVLLIFADDLRPALGAYGDTRAITPNIDQLAKQSVMFNRAYTNVPVCGASRASLMTGIYPTPTRFVKYYDTAETHAAGAVSLPQVFKQQGYTTLSNGKVFHDPRDLDEESWSEPAWRPEVKEHAFFNKASEAFVKENPTFGPRGPWFEQGNANDEAYFDHHVATKTIADLRKLAAEKKPFFIANGFFRPHLPFNAPKKYFDLYKHIEFKPFYHREDPYNAPSRLRGSSEIKMWHFKGYDYNSDAFHKASLLGYYATVSFVDKLVGDVLTALDELGLRDNTIVILTSDHGFNLGEHNYWTKHNVRQTATRIPLIIDAPGKPADKKADQLVSLIDLFPTLIDLAGIKADQALQQQLAGESLTPILKAPDTAPSAAQVYTRFRPADTVITERFSYTEYVNQDGSKSNMLFDLKYDPDETYNIVDLPQYAETVAKLAPLLDHLKKNAERWQPE